MWYVLEVKLRNSWVVAHSMFYGAKMISNTVEQLEQQQKTLLQTRRYRIRECSDGGRVVREFEPGYKTGCAM